MIKIIFAAAFTFLICLFIHLRILEQFRIDIEKQNTSIIDSIELIKMQDVLIEQQARLILRCEKELIKTHFKQAQWNPGTEKYNFVYKKRSK